MDTPSEYAVLSKASYDFYYGHHKEARAELDAYGFENYRIDEDHSDGNSITIVRPDTSAVISYRGTDFTSASDLLADWQILVGLHSNPFMEPLNPSNRFEEASQKYERVKEKYPNVSLTGHSLGGAQALHVARRHSADSYTFNPGASPFAEPFTLLTSDRPQTVFTTGDDFISYASYLSKDHIITVPRKDKMQYYSHSLVNFLPPRVSHKKPPDYLDSIHKETYERINMCDLFPELCPRKRS